MDGEGVAGGLKPEPGNLPLQNILSCLQRGFEAASGRFPCADGINRRMP